MLDGLTEALALHGFNLNDNTDIAKFVKMLPRRIQRSGAAVLSLDHVVKGGGGRFALGGQHKLAGLDGSAFTVEIVRAGGRGQEAVSRLTVAKDRPGFVRAIAVQAKTAAEVRLRTTPDGNVEILLEAAAAFTKDDLGLTPAERRVFDALPGPDRPSYPREIGDRVVEMGWTPGFSRETIQRALGVLAGRALADSADHRWWRRDEV